MKRWIALISVLFSLVYGSAYAVGAWSGGGGGEAIGNKVNPWWLHNTKTVEVCVIWNKADFQHKTDNIDNLVEKVHFALDYWKQDAKNAFTVGDFTSIAQQEFSVVETITLNGLEESPTPSCHNRDLRIQFGWLNAKQIGFFENNLGGVQKYIASAIRTDYDKKNMRAKGFLYIKPNQGPLSSRKAGMVENPWQKGKGYLLDHALVHELGHTFGIPHKSVDTVMSIEFLERILNVSFAEDYSNDRSQKGFFSWDKSDGSVIRKYCWNLSIAWQKLLSLPKGYHCLEVSFQNGNINFYEYPEPDKDKSNPQETDTENKLLGTLFIEKDRTFGWEDTVRIYMPEEQQVFDQFPQGSGVHSWHVGPMIKYVDLAGYFKSADGEKSFWTMLTLNTNGVGFSGSRFSATIEGNFYTNLDFGKR